MKSFLVLSKRANDRLLKEIDRSVPKKDTVYETSFERNVVLQRLNEFVEMNE